MHSSRTPIEGPTGSPEVTISEGRSLEDDPLYWNESPASHGIIGEDDLVVLHRDPGPGGIVAVYRIEGPGKLKLPGW